MWTRSELEVLAGDPAWRDRQIKRLLGGALGFLPCWLRPFQNERWKEPEEMKRQLGREKDEKDIDLIRDFLNHHMEISNKK